MIAARSPRAWRRRGLQKRKSTAGILADRFPVCKLHGVRVVYRFPDGCPLGSANPLDRMLQIQRRGWEQFADDRTNDDRGGLTLLDIVDICDACVDRLLPNRHVHYLRERARRHD